MEIMQLKCETSDMLELLDLADNCLKGDDVTVSALDGLPSLFYVGSHILVTFVSKKVD